jgi:sugar O-acyltransferase (sialic acid O-acetyltransferase NeuD family)
MTESPGARKLLIIGAGRHGRVVADTALAAGSEIAGFLDDTRPAGSEVEGVAVLGGFARRTEPALLAEVAVIVALGDNAARLRLADEVEGAGGVLATVVARSCDVAPSARIGPGVFIGSFGRVRPGARIGRCALIESHCGIGTDALVGAGAFLGPGVQTTGGTALDAAAFVGAGAMIIEEARVGAHSVVGANSTVREDVPAGVMVMGSPATIRRTLLRSEE